MSAKNLVSSGDSSDEEIPKVSQHVTFAGDDVEPEAKKEESSLAEELEGGLLGLLKSPEMRPVVARTLFCTFLVMM